MPQYLVTLEGEGREVYVVDADNEQDARDNWHAGQLVIQETYGMDVVSVEVDE